METNEEKSTEFSELSNLEPIKNRKRRLIKLKNVSGKRVKFSINENPLKNGDIKGSGTIKLNPTDNSFLHNFKKPVLVTLDNNVTSYYITESDYIYVNINIINEEDSNKDNKLWKNKEIFCPHGKITHFNVIKKHAVKAENGPI